MIRGEELLLLRDFLVNEQGEADFLRSVNCTIAKFERDLGELHAFPGQENEASNALCRSAGFELIGTDQGEFAGKPIVSNHWRLTLQRPPEPGPGG